MTKTTNSKKPREFQSIYCHRCGFAQLMPMGIDYEDCPKCDNMYRKRMYRAIWCDECGTEVQLTDSLTNECSCGAFYNGFGQRLSHPNNWDEEDRYACFGPRNYREDY